MSIASAAALRVPSSGESTIASVFRGLGRLRFMRAATVLLGAVLFEADPGTHATASSKGVMGEGVSLALSSPAKRWERMSR